MATEPTDPQHHLVEALRRSLNAMSKELDRVELLTAALASFGDPVPEYEPRFRHLGRTSRAIYEIGHNS